MEKLSRDSEEEEREIKMGDFSDDDAWRQQAWLETAKEEDEYNEWVHSELVHCKLCDELFYFDGFEPQYWYCEECCKDCEV